MIKVVLLLYWLANELVSMVMSQCWLSNQWDPGLILHMRICKRYQCKILGFVRDANVTFGGQCILVCVDVVVVMCVGGEGVRQCMYGCVFGEI